MQPLDGDVVSIARANGTRSARPHERVSVVRAKTGVLTSGTAEKPGVSELTCTEPSTRGAVASARRHQQGKDHETEQRGRSI